MKTQSKARGPASIGNCAAGFDVLGHSFAGPNDVVTVSLREDSDIVITDIRCGDAELPTDPERNTARCSLRSAVARALQSQVAEHIALATNDAVAGPGVPPWAPH